MVWSLFYAYHQLIIYTIIQHVQFHRTGVQFMGLNIAKTGTYPFVEGKLLRIRIVKQPKVRSYGFLQRILHQCHSLYWLHKSYCPLFVPVLYFPMIRSMGLYLLFNVACLSGLMHVEIVMVLLLLNEQALIDNGILLHIQYITIKIGYSIMTDHIR